MKFKEMIVDLTPLLDVILILMFMVIASSSQVSNEQITALEQEVQNLESTQIPTTETERVWYQTYQEAIGKINIVFQSSVDAEPMYIVLEDGSTIYKPETQDLQEWLISYINQIEEDVVIVAFSYDNEAIYLRDYRNIVSAITRIDQSLDKTVVYKEQLLEE